MVVLQLLTPSGSTYSLLNPLPWLSMLVLTTTVCKIILDTSNHSLLPNLFLSLSPPFLPFPISLVLFLLLCVQPASSSPSQNLTKICLFLTHLSHCHTFNSNPRGKSELVKALFTHCNSTRHLLRRVVVAGRHDWRRCKHHWWGRR